MNSPPIPTFDIFSGYFGAKNAMWIEAVEGLGNAADRMRVFAAEKPGAYFVFCAATRQVLATIDTTPKLESKRNIG